jgi:aquaporin Z
MPWVTCPAATSTPQSPLGLTVAKRFEWKDVPAYIGTQVIAGLVAGGLLVLVASGKPGFDPTGNMAANGYGEHSPGGYSLVACLVTEVLLTGFFLYVILGATDTRAPEGFAPIAIGLTLTLIHLISIPLTNTSVNPARSTGVAFFNGNGAPAQLWLFWLAPIIGAAIAGATYALITGVHREDREVAGDVAAA